MSKPRILTIWSKFSGFFLLLIFNEQKFIVSVFWDLFLQDFSSNWGYCRINGQECVYSRILQDYSTNLTPEQIFNQHKIHSYSSKNVTKSGRISTQNTWSFSLRIYFFQIEMNGTNLFALALGEEEVFWRPISENLLHLLLSPDHQGLRLGNPGQKCVIQFLGPYPKDVRVNAWRPLLSFVSIMRQCLYQAFSQHHSFVRRGSGFLEGVENDLGAEH